MIKKLLNILLVLFLVLPIFGKASFIYADEDDETQDVEEDIEEENEESEEEYSEEESEEESQEEEVEDNRSDREKCIEDNDHEACEIIKDSRRDELNELEEKIKAAEDDEAKARELAAQFAAQAAKSEAEMSALLVQIEELKTRIAELEVQIADNEAKVEELNKRVKDRMAAYQKTMHFNGYLDFILGSKSFTDMLRRIYGVEAVSSKDKSDREEFIDVITKLNNDKVELDESKKTLDESYDDLVIKKAEYDRMYEFYQEEIERIEEELTRLTEERNKVEHFDDDPEIKEALMSIGLINNGFVAAVHNSYITEGVWHYADGFLDGTWHTGVDYAASYGSDLHAPAGGIIIRADGSCVGRNDSYSCGEWISGGGNQVYLIAEVDNVVYGFMFFHLSQVYVKKGDIVDQDEVIGLVGDSGHSYGAHCHIEMYKLGHGTLADIASIGWDSTFGLGRHAELYGNRCSVKGSPCIVDPSDYLPG